LLKVSSDDDGRKEVVVDVVGMGFVVFHILSSTCNDDNDDDDMKGVAGFNEADNGGIDNV
jgi:hypothetical protein